MVNIKEPLQQGCVGWLSATYVLSNWDLLFPLLNLLNQKYNEARYGLSTKLQQQNGRDSSELNVIICGRQIAAPAWVLYCVSYFLVTIPTFISLNPTAENLKVICTLFG
jgi:hypothetical protein